MEVERVQADIEMLKRESLSRSMEREFRRRFGKGWKESGLYISFLEQVVLEVNVLAVWEKMLREEALKRLRYLFEVRTNG